MPGLMIQGTGSNVGKSLIVAGLCRALRLRGLSVAPFKPQNMSNNAAVTADGGEIGRAQALQARAAGLAPHSDMNPVLLKPETDMGAQVIVRGKRLGRFPAREYWTMKGRLMTAVLDSYHRLEAAHDLMVIEGAGSASETNLRATDIANMGFASQTRVPVFLLGDIDRGGVIAQIVGTKAVIDPSDAELIKGFIVNKFRGDPRLFDAGYSTIEALSGWPGMGVIPAFDRAHLLPAEDAQDIRLHAQGKGLRVGWLVLSRLANFDDLDPLGAEDGIELVAILPGEAIPGDLDLVILPGSKSTRGDLAFLRSQGWDIDLLAHYRRGGRILGICGGYQMLGRHVHDPHGFEGAAGSSEGLGLLDVETVLEGDKTLRLVQARHLASGQQMSGYEIHLGVSNGPDRLRPFAEIAGLPEGATSACGRVSGTYLHGLFGDDGFRAAYLAAMGAASTVQYEAQIEAVLDELAAHLERHLAIDAMLRLAGL
ncbi:cobyric acid synthase [Paracoccus sp. (in: a-proteobacteria)]|uniref:cobyric acid synthase n=1 Tax=Paracoccus sp. TaxID=267 RepID=UPI0028965856|nr:cobyric acid synthase [Paracoccus sp. (in: a-proteobacteria)]